jgi:hypothetical protein
MIVKKTQKKNAKKNPKKNQKKKKKKKVVGNLGDYSAGQYWLFVVIDARNPRSVVRRHCL